MTDTRPIKLFVNPVAGKGKCGKDYSVAVQFFQQSGFDCDVMVSQYPGHITQASSEIAARTDGLVVACGGDGTVNELVNGMAGTKTAMGVVPLGRSNNFANAVGIPMDMENACRVIADGHQKKTHLIKVNDDKLICGAGFVGFKNELAAFKSLKRATSPQAGSFRQIGSLLKNFSFQPKTVELRFNGFRHFGEVLLVMFENGHALQNETGLERESGDEGPGPEPQLRICVVESISRWFILSRLSAIHEEGAPKKKGVTCHHSSAVHVQSLGPLGLYSDGEYVTSTPFRLQIMPKLLNVFVPAPS